MLQILSMLFFSLMAFGAVALLSGILIENWHDVRQALLGGPQAMQLPLPRTARIRRGPARAPAGTTIAQRAAA